MNQSDVERLGYCHECKVWLPLKSEEHGLPEHIDSNGVKCRHSGMSYWGLKYRILTPQGAASVAQWIHDDNGKCLDRGIYGGGHSINCGDGADCADTRLRWAKALAEYVLRGLRG